MKRYEIVLLTIILVAALAVRLYFFGGTYGSDDLRHAYHSYFLFQPEARETAEISCPKGVAYLRMGVNLPLSFVIWLFGPHEWAMALVPLTASLASIAIVFALLRRLKGPVAGLLGAGMYAFLPADVYVATVWLQDNLFVCFFALFLLCLIYAHEAAKHRRIWAVAAGLALGYMQICKESACLLIGIVGLWWLYDTWRWRRIHLAVFYVVMGFFVSQVLVGVLFLFLEGDFYYYPASVYSAIQRVRVVVPPRYTYGQIFEILGAYAFKQWEFGFASVLLPATAFLALWSRDNRYPLLVGLIFVAQLVIVCQPMRWTPAQGRYMLQLTLPFVLLTVLGIGTAQRWFPATWRARTSVFAFALLVLSGALALDKSAQQYSYARAESFRRVHAFLSDNAEEDEPIYVDSRGWGRTQRVLYQLNGFQSLKGGFRSINEAYEAKSGWVVLSCFDGHLPGGARWLEVYRCDEKQYWARVFKVLPRRPERGMRVLRPSGRGLLHLPLPDVAEEQFTAVTFDEPAEGYRSHWGEDPAAVTVTKDHGELRVNVVASKAVEHGAYGGVRFFTGGLRALRFSATFHNAENIKAVFVDGCEATGRRVARWEWQLRSGRRPAEEPETFVLVPGEAAGYFRPIGKGDPDAIDEVHVFILVEAGAEAGFVLHDVAVVPTPVAQPNLDAYSLRPIGFSEVASDHLSHWSANAKHASVQRFERGLRFTLETDADAPSTALRGGVKIAVVGLQALRMAANFEQPENIDAVYVDGYDAKRKRLLRWRWLLTPARWPAAGPTEFALVPGQPAAFFLLLDAADGAAVEEVHVFIQAKPGSTCAFTLQDVLVAEPPLPTPDLSEYDLRSFPLSGSPEQYNSRWSAKAKAVSLERYGPRGLRCTIEAETDAASNARYAGIRLPVSGVRAFRLRTSFEQPENIESLYVDGYDRNRNRVLRWEWILTPMRKPQTEPVDYGFIPGQYSAHFEPVGDAAGDDVAELHVFLRAKPGTSCGFILHDVQVATLLPPEPDVSAYRFSEIEFAEPAERWLSPKWCNAPRVSATLTPAGLRCDVGTEPRREGGQYGGIRLKVEDTDALRLAVTLLRIENIEAVYVDGYGPDDRRLVRWDWRPSLVTLPEETRRIWTFVPGEPVGRFECSVESSAEPIAAVDVFLRVAPDAEAGFVIHSAEVGTLDSRGDVER